MKLSVVIAARDAEPFLAAAIDSALRELPADSELIVVDDASADGTARVLAGYADRLRALRNSAPLGAGETRNRGARAAAGEILAFHDADDLVLPGRFTHLLAALDADPRLDLAFGNGVKCDAAGRRLGPVIPERHARRLRRRAGPAEMLLGGVVYPQALCVRRARFLELGGFVPERVEDWEFALRASLALRFAFVDRPVFAYRRHPGSMTMREYEYAHAMLAMLERFVAGHPELERHAARREIDAAIARILARCAKHRQRTGDLDGAAQAFARAVALAPWKLRYRWHLVRLPRASRARAAAT